MKGGKRTPHANSQDDTPELAMATTMTVTGLSTKASRRWAHHAKMGQWHAQTGTLACNLEGNGLICSVEVLPPDVELRNGFDDDCDGTVDETFPNLAEPVRANGACSFAGTISCSPDGLDGLLSGRLRRFLRAMRRYRQ